MIDTCHNCSNEYKNLSMHWYNSNSCNYPELTRNQKQVITGVLMGDGCIANSGGNPRLEVGMVNEEYLNWLNSVLGKYGNGVKIHKTAKESAYLNRDRGFRPNADPENYQDIYRLSSRSSPEFKEFENWYSSGEKVFPDNTKLMPTVLKNWYVCDGHYRTSGSHNNITIAATNEMERFSVIEGWFKDIGFNAKFSGHAIRFSNDESETMFKYMGDPPPGFDRKWPENF